MNGTFLKEKERKEEFIMKKITLRVYHFTETHPKLGPYLRYEWAYIYKNSRRVYYEED